MGDRMGGGFEGLAADRVEDHVGAAAAGLLAHARRDVLAAAVDDDVGAELAAEGMLLGAGRGGEHARSERAADLQRGRTGAARRAEHQQRLAARAARARRTSAT